MKNSLIILFFLFTSIFGFCQNAEINKYSVVSLYQSQKFYLNSGNRAALMGGTSRATYKVILPANTVKWYYMCTAVANEQAAASAAAQANLAGNLTKLIDVSGISGSLVKGLMAPTGANALEVCLLQEQSNIAFLEKKDWTGTALYTVEQGFRSNFNDGVIEITDVLSGTYYIGFKNPSSTTGINIIFEAAAIVENGRSENITKADLYGKMGWKSYLAGDYAKCIEFSKKAQSFYNDWVWVDFNIALVNLIQNNVEYLDNYINALTKSSKLENGKSNMQGALQDILDYEAKNGTLSNSKEIKELFQSELSK